MFKNPKVFISLLFILASLKGLAQGQGNSAYSIFGIGEIITETNAAQDMMGGTGVSFANSFYANPINPALLSKNRTVGFNKYVAFNVGLKGAYRVMNQQGKTPQDNFGMNLNHLTFVFPVKSKWATGVSIKPYSINEHTSRRTNLFEGSTINNIREFKSTGGLSKVSWSNGVQVAKWLYAGIDAAYLFGNINHDTTASLSGSAEYFRNTTRTDLGGYNAKMGLASTFKLNKKWNLNLGAVYDLGSNLKGEQLSVYSVLAETNNGPTYIQAPDTLGIKSVNSQAPGAYKIGLSLESVYHWVLALDYGKTTWAGLSHFDKNAAKVMVDASELNVGLEWLPNSKSGRYIDQMFYRIGYRDAQMPYLINGFQPKDRSLSLGVSVPLGFRSPSYIDIAVSVGRRGSSSSSLIAENYTKISVNFSMLSSWFIKPKIE
jgi:hypothetical protein